MDLSFADVSRRLSLDPAYEVWRDSFDESLALADDRDVLPQGAELRALCRELRFPDFVIDPVVGSAVEIETNPGLRRLLAHGRWLARHEVPRLGTWFVPWLPLPEALGQAGRLFYAYVFLAETPRVRRWHADQRIPDDVSIDTLSDLGVNLWHYHRMYDCFGLDEMGWLGHHFAGQLLRLGRLQFQMGTWWIPVADDAQCELALRDPILDIHIADIGPLDPDACDESIERARELFPKRFPEFEFRAFGCWSWLLDPQLQEYLPPTSNIVQFQKRFRPVPTGKSHDGMALKFVFRKTADTPLDTLPQRSIVQRSVIRHLGAGRRFDCCLGYFF